LKTQSQHSLLVIVALAAVIPSAFACTWAQGYFHQVTSLKGTVVGVHDGDLRHPFPRLRKLVTRSDVRLTLYTYPEYASGIRVGHEVRSVGVDQKGYFDFGALAEGHYTLDIKGPGLNDMYDVQITALPRPTSSVTIDVSPNYPDCTGGHVFIAK
jgi:hypothetical protein